MIIFYNTKTGDIVGTIKGRITTNMHKNMRVVDENVDRLIINWKPTKWLDDNGKIIKGKRGKVNAYTIISSPDHPHKATASILEKIDKGEDNIKSYLVDLKTKNLIKK